MRRRWRLYVFIFSAIVILAGVFSLPRIPQSPDYHKFADARSFFGIPNFFDFVSNIPFLAAGVWGLLITIPLRTAPAFNRHYERWPYILFFAGVALTCFGSWYYHWSPDNSTLLWDRLPMAIAFMGILAGAIGDRIDPRAGLISLTPMLAVGVFSVFSWYASELNGAGDMRLYIYVQLFTIIAILLLVVLFRSRYSHSGWLFAAGGAYILAKVFELLDKPIFHFAGISGHTLKHLAAASAAFLIIAMIKRRHSC